jgi:multiple sugar transport system substrate-binding protein
MRSARTLAIGAVALTLLAAGCSSSDDDGGGDTGGAIGGDIRIWTHTNKSFNKAYQALADEYMAENPDVSISLETFEYDTYIQTLQTSLPAGTEADVLQMFGSWTCSRDEFFKGPLGGDVCDDELYGLPQESNVEYGATLVNTAMAEDAGVTLDGWDSYDDFKADAKAMTVTSGDKISRSGYHFTTNDGISYTFLSLILQNGGAYIAEDGTFTFTTPEAKESLELMKSFVDEGIVDPVLFDDVSNWVGDCFFTEQCAMGLVGPWVVPEYAGDFPDVAAVTEYVALPTLENGEFAADSGWGLTTSAASQEQDVAWDFISYVTQNADNALQWNLSTGTLPALKENVEGDARDQLVAEASYTEPFLDILADAQYLGSLPDRDRLFYKIIVPNVLEALSGKVTVDEALAAIDQEANSL